MRFRRKDKDQKSIVIVSDLHLGAGTYVDGKFNPLEDFQSDEEFVDFLVYYSSGDFLRSEVELIINGDFFDFLAVPYVAYFDDEFWSEEATLKKLELILQAHPEVLNGLIQFVAGKNKRLTYIIGNHDAELLFPSVQARILQIFPERLQNFVKILVNPEEFYQPSPGIFVRHGHVHELAHCFNPHTSIVQDAKNRKYFLPPWGSYYVMRVINKFKVERGHINAVRPIKKFIINGLIYDPFFTLRFIFSNLFYFFMVRGIFLLKSAKSLAQVRHYFSQEINLFQDYEELNQQLFKTLPEMKILVLGHTHHPFIRHYSDGKTFVNLGTWVQMYNLDFRRVNNLQQLTYLHITFNGEGSSGFEANLNCWRGRNQLPFSGV